MQERAPAKLNLAKKQRYQLHSEICLCLCPSCGMVYESPLIDVESSSDWAKNCFYTNSPP